MSAEINFISQDNVVYLRTYKILRELRKTVIGYKNSYLAMAPERREAERTRIARFREENPLALQAYLYQKAQQEVDNG